jgi:hypothetical protein
MKRPRRVLAIHCCQNALRSFSLIASTKISHHGICSHARTRCGCYKTSTTRNFVAWLFWYCHNAFCLFYSLIERFPSLSVTCTLNEMLNLTPMRFGFHWYRHVGGHYYCRFFRTHSNDDFATEDLAYVKSHSNAFRRNWCETELPADDKIGCWNTSDLELVCDSIYIIQCTKCWY